MKELFEAEVWLRQMARLRNFVRKNSPRGFRAVLFRMVPKLFLSHQILPLSFRAVLFRMVPKLIILQNWKLQCFRAVLFRIVLMIFLSMKINQNFSENVFQRFSKIYFYGKIESEFI